MQQSLFSLRFPDTVGYDSHASDIALSATGNIARNMHKGRILIILPSECPGKMTGQYELCHTGITSTDIVRQDNGLFSVTVKSNLAVYLPKECNNQVAECRNLKEVVSECAKIGVVLSGEWTGLIIL